MNPDLTSASSGAAAVASRWSWSLGTQMSTRATFLIAIAAATLGLVLGLVGASWYWLNFNSGFMTSSLVSRTQADLVTKELVLERLRAGRAEDATKLLETFLDGDLIGAGALARDGHKFNANARRAVVRELEARRLSVYEPSDPNVRAAVQEAFRLVPAGADAERTQPRAAGDAR